MYLILCIGGKNVFTLSVPTGYFIINFLLKMLIYFFYYLLSFLEHFNVYRLLKQLYSKCTFFFTKMMINISI